MKLIDTENGTINLSQGSMDENLSVRLPDRGQVNPTSFPWRALLGIAAAWTRIKDWYGASSSTGTIPNLHIDG